MAVYRSSVSTGDLWPYIVVLYLLGTYGRILWFCNYWGLMAVYCGSVTTGDLWPYIVVL